LCYASSSHKPTVTETGACQQLKPLTGPFRLYDLHFFDESLIQLGHGVFDFVDYIGGVEHVGAVLHVIQNHFLVVCVVDVEKRVKRVGGA